MNYAISLPFVKSLIEMGCHVNCGQLIWEKYLSPFDKWLVVASKKFKTNREMMTTLDKIERQHLCDRAAFNGNFAMITLCKLYHVNPVNSTIVSAVKGNRLNVVHWLLDNDVSFGPTVLTTACKYCRIDILKYISQLKESLVRPTRNTFIAAARCTVNTAAILDLLQNCYWPYFCRYILILITEGFSCGNTKTLDYFQNEYHQPYITVQQIINSNLALIVVRNVTESLDWCIKNNYSLNYNVIKHYCSSKKVLTWLKEHTI